jgi:uncharacterized protein (UPF0548 family)
MGIHHRQPTEHDLRNLLTLSSADELTYSPEGISGLLVAPDGYRLDRWSQELGKGIAVFERGVLALQNWTVHRDAGLIVATQGPPAVGDTVAMAAPIWPLWIDVVCRIVNVVADEHRCGFSYGTLTEHPEQGEESFTVHMDDRESVRFEIIAVSRPRHPLARAAAPVARLLQRQATNRYLTAMQDHVLGT